MTIRTKQNGFSLTELIVTVAIVGILAGIGLPAVKQIVSSFESSSRLYDVVGSAMANARAMALAKNTYVGVRFQRTAEGDQYMVFIEHDDTATGLANGFRPVTGKNPIRLPRQGVVLDLHLGDVIVDNDAMITPLANPTPSRPDIDWFMRDMTTFSVVFSPAGKLVLQPVRVRNVSPADDVFNRNYDWRADDAPQDYYEPLLYIDDYPAVGLGEETSRNHFLIIEKNILNGAPADQRYSGMLEHMEAVYINPYTGELIYNQ